MKYTLVRIVQLILSSMDSDEVNSIEDTVESRQIADIVEVTYNDIMSSLDLPEHLDLFELQPSNDVTRPTLMYLPAGVQKIDWVQYDISPPGSTKREMQPVKPRMRYEMFNLMNVLDTANPDIYQYDYVAGVNDTGTFDIRGYNDRNPGFYTSVDDKTLIFDNFDSSVGQTLMGNRTMCYGMLIPPFVRDDQWVAPIDDRNFTILLNEAKDQAFLELKQVQNAKATQRARRGMVQSQRTKAAIPGGAGITNAPGYGRKRH